MMLFGAVYYRHVRQQSDRLEMFLGLGLSFVLFLLWKRSRNKMERPGSRDAIIQGGRWHFAAIFSLILVIGVLPMAVIYHAVRAEAIQLSAKHHQWKLAQALQNRAMRHIINVGHFDEGLEEPETASKKLRLLEDLLAVKGKDAVIRVHSVINPAKPASGTASGPPSLLPWWCCWSSCL